MMILRFFVNWAHGSVSIQMLIRNFLHRFSYPSKIYRRLCMHGTLQYPAHTVLPSGVLWHEGSTAAGSGLEANRGLARCKSPGNCNTQHEAKACMTCSSLLRVRKTNNFFSNFHLTVHTLPSAPVHLLLKGVVHSNRSFRRFTCKLKTLFPVF